MSGHSKWSQIKRQKGVADVKRGETFTKLANAITIAVSQGGGTADPESNFRLRLAVEHAKQANMPKENIQRAIERGRGMGAGGELLETVIYEGFGPSGIAILIEAITDNKQRAYNQIRTILEKNGGRLAGQGAVSFLFIQVGLITVSRDSKNFDDFMMMAADAGAQDAEETPDLFLVYTRPEELNAVKLNLARAGANVLEAELFRKPNTYVQIENPEAALKIMNLMNILEGCDDVHKAYANFKV